MSEDLDKLQRLLEQATAAEGASEDDLNPQTGSLREAWTDFGRLLEAAQPAPYYSPLPTNLRSVPGEGQVHNSPLPLGEGQGVRAIPRPARRRRRLLAAAALLAASLLIGVLTTWTLRETEPSMNPSPAQQQTAATKAGDATLVQQNHTAAPTANGPQWDDSLDEQIAQVGRRMIYAQQDLYAGADACGLVQYKMEQIQRDLEGNEL